MTSVGAREANRSFSKILKEAENGKSITITRNGRPVAQLVPAPPVLIVKTRSEKERKAALERLMKRLEKGFHLGGKGFTRDEMHER